MVNTHDRQPVTLTPELARECLDPATPNECAEQMVLLQGEPTEVFEWFKVDRTVGNVQKNGPILLKTRSEILGGAVVKNQRQLIKKKTNIIKDRKWTRRGYQN